MSFIGAGLAGILKGVGAAGMSVGSSWLDHKFRMKGIREQNRQERNLANDQRQHNWKMWEVQNKEQWRQQQKLWHQQNEYMHPQAQMARLKDAGLNPHLIYATSPSSAVGPQAGGSTSVPDVKGYDRASARSVMEGFSAFSDILRNNNIQAVTDNLQAQKKVADQEAVKKSYETLNTAVSTARKKFDLGLSKDLRDTSVQAAEANASSAVDKARKDFHQANIAERTEGAEVQMVNSKVKQIIASTKESQISTRLKQLEVQLNEAGVQKSDHLILRAMMRTKKGRQVIKRIAETGANVSDFIFNPSRN